MFEQTFVNRADAVRHPWSMAVSVAAQCAFTGAILIVPLLHTAELAWRPAPTILFVPARPTPPPMARQSVAAAPAAIQMRQMFRPVFAAPRHVPTSIATLPDPSVPDLLLSSSISNSGPILFGIPQLGAENGPAPTAITVPKPAPTPKPSPIRVSNGVQAAKLLQQIKPTYPQLARAARISGTVRLQAIIGRDGTIRNLLLVGGPPLLVAAALDAVSRWVYKPTLLNGEPVEVFTEIEVNFTLSQLLLFFRIRIQSMRAHRFGNEVI